MLRDLDILTEMARKNLCVVCISVTTLDNNLKRIMEPRTASPAARLRALQTLNDAGIRTAVMASPMIPAINDAELESILEAAADIGTRSAGYIFLRLPHEVRPLFHQWLETHFPDRAEHVKSLIRQSRGGKDYQADWGKRFSGTGVFAETISQRFKLQMQKTWVKPNPDGQFGIPRRFGCRLIACIRRKQKRESRLVFFERCYFVELSLVSPPHKRYDVQRAC